MASSFFDWTSQEFYTHLAIAGGVLVVVALALYALPGARLKVPGIALSLVGGLGAGVALGVVLMAAQGYQLAEPKRAEGDSSSRPDGPPPGMMPMTALPSGGRGPNYKNQLTSLVSRLDVLTEKPLTVALSDKQRKEIREQLKDVDDDDLSDDEAREKVEKLQVLLEGQKGTLEAAGYRWQGPGGGPAGRGGPQPPANPFKSEPNAKHLKSLTERLDKGAKG